MNNPLSICIRFSILLLSLGLFNSKDLYSQDTVACDGKLFMIYGQPNSNEPVKFGTIDSTTGSFTSISDTNVFYTVVGFNPIDHFIYCYDRTSKQIHRYNNQGFVSNLGVVSGLNVTENMYAGGFHSNGKLYITGHPNDNSIYVVSISGNSATLSSTITRQFSGSQTGTPYFGDISYDKLSGMFYGVEITTGLFSSVHPTTGIVTPVSNTYSGADVLSGTFINQNGFYGYGRTASSQNNVLFRCNISTGLCTSIGTGITSDNIDACSCGSTCEEKQTVISDTACSDTGFTYLDTTYYDSGTYNHSFQSANGCDSIVVLNISIRVATPAGCYPMSVEETHGESWQVYPNPSAGSTTIEIEGLGDAYFELYGIDGSLILEQDLVSNQTIISGIPRGIYMIHLQNQGVAHWNKLLVLTP
jgi:hypothetical protein